MKVTAFTGEDSVNRRLAMEAAIKETGETPVSFDLSQPTDLQRALECLGGFFQAPPVMVWRKAEALKKLQPQRLNELTLDRFEVGDHQQLFMEIEDTGTRNNGKPSMTAYKLCFPPQQEVKVETFPLPAPWMTDRPHPVDFEAGREA